MASDPQLQAQLLSLKRSVVLGRAALDLPEESWWAPGGSAREDCAEAAGRAEAALGSAWAAGGAGGLFAAVERLACGGCSRAGLDQFVLASLARASPTPEQAAIQAASHALLDMRCAAERPLLGPDEAEHLLAALRAVETAVWQGLGFPLLQELAVRHLMALLRAGHLMGRVVEEQSSGVCGGGEGPDHLPSPALLGFPSPVVQDDPAALQVRRVEQDLLATAQIK